MNLQPINKFLPNDYAPRGEKQVLCEKHGEYTSYLFIDWTKCERCKEIETSKQHALEREQEVANMVYKRTTKIIEDNLKQSMIPIRFEHSTFDNYHVAYPQQRQIRDIMLDYANNCINNRKLGRNIILSGNPGNGKTHLAISIAKIAISKQFTALYSTMYSMIANVHNKGFNRASEMDIYNTPDFLIIDEVSDMLNSVDRPIFFEILNNRYANNKINILITNLSQENLIKLLGVRLFERLKDRKGLILFCGWESYRK